jgi:hypothetical protein
MQLVLIGSAASCVCAWRDYALLRDNVQHFIERGLPSERFAALHGIEAAVDAGACVVDAARLRGETLRAWYALWHIRIAEAAMSTRTRAILTGSISQASTGDTHAARSLGWRLPVVAADTTRVSEAAQRFVSSVLEVTEHAVDGDTLEVRRSGHAPRFARRSHIDSDAVPMREAVGWRR